MAVGAVLPFGKAGVALGLQDKTGTSSVRALGSDRPAGRLGAAPAGPPRAGHCASGSSSSTPSSSSFVIFAASWFYPLPVRDVFTPLA